MLSKEGCYATNLGSNPAVLLRRHQDQQRPGRPVNSLSQLGSEVLCLHTIVVAHHGRHGQCPTDLMYREDLSVVLWCNDVSETALDCLSRE